MKPLDIVISFDDTGSMASCRQTVRRELKTLTSNILKTFADSRLGIIIHNDYCDKDTIQELFLTDNESEITNFIGRSSSQGGGDADECYELVLNKLNHYNWRPDSNRVAIVIGDCEPHKVGYTLNGIRYTIDWKEEVQNLKANNVKVYGVQALNNRSATYFYEGISKQTGGIKLDLSQLANTLQYISAIAYNEQGQLDDYENSNTQFKTNISFKNMFAKLRGVEPSSTTSSVTSSGVRGTGDLSRFQVIDVFEVDRIDHFVRNMGVRFVTGKGFYQLVKSETVQARKQVVLVHKLTGEVIDDVDKAREIIGLKYGVEGTVSPRKLPLEAREYDIFIQSTSYTRKLDKNTKFLYEVETGY